MSTTENKPIENRYDFVYLFDCQDGNPNGDPDADNSPRTDPETSQGLVSDVCVKRKIRDFVSYANPNPGALETSEYNIFVQSGSTLESRQRLPFEQIAEPEKIEAKGKDTKPKDIEKARRWMCKHFFDIRAFGAVMSTTDFNCGQVRGPAQVTFSRSIDRILPTEHTISRQAFTGESTPSHTGCIADMDSSIRSSLRRPALAKAIWHSSGRHSATSLSLTIRRHGARWRSAACISSSTSASLAIPRHKVCSTASW
jgi:CRISPR-associated protein Csd2